MDLEKFKNFFVESVLDSLFIEDMMLEGKLQIEFKFSCFDGMDEFEKLEIYF